MNLKLLSKYRTELMGIAIFYIFLFHIYDIGYAYKIRSYGYVGVDIFLMLSGIGLVYSWKNSILEFYKKRVIRIIPVYFIICLMYILLLKIIENKFNITETIFVFTGLNFWINGDKLFWYIPAVLVLYLIFPLLYKGLSYGEKTKKWVNLLILLGFLYLMILAILFSKLNYLLIFFSRIPIFIIGCFIGKMLKEEKEDISLIWIIASGVLGIAVMFVSNKLSIDTGKWVGAGLVIIPACLIVAKAMEKIENNKILNNIIKFFKFIGKYSLEIYLIHVVIFNFDKYIKIMIYGDEKIKGGMAEIRYLGYFIVTVIISFILNKIAGLLKNK